MQEKEQISQKDYDEIVRQIKEKEDYDDLSDKEKERMDKVIDEVMAEKYEIKESDESDDSDHSERAETSKRVDNSGGEKIQVTREAVERVKENKRISCGYYEMNDDQKKEFDNYLDKKIEDNFDIYDEQADKEEIEKTEESDIQHVKRLTR